MDCLLPTLWLLNFAMQFFAVPIGNLDLSTATIGLSVHQLLLALDVLYLKSFYDTVGIFFVGI
jgi:hypothetical protein